MAARQAQLASGRAVGAQLVGHKLVGRRALLFEQLPHEPQGSLGVALGLDQQVQDLALAVDGSPQVRALALDRDHHLVQVPRSCRYGSQPAQVASEQGPELQHPAADGLVRGLDSALGQEFLDIAVAQREPKVEPYSVPDDLGWELVASVGDGLHGAALPRTIPGRPPSRDKAVGGHSVPSWSAVFGPEAVSMSLAL